MHCHTEQGAWAFFSHWTGRAYVTKESRQGSREPTLPQGFVIVVVVVVAAVVVVVVFLGVANVVTALVALVVVALVDAIVAMVLSSSTS